MPRSIPGGDSLETPGTMVLLAGYAVHEQPFNVVRPEGLSSYLIRLQTEGSARALVNGEMVAVQPGELLFLRPGAPYRLSVNEPPGPHTVSGDYFLFCAGPWLETWWDEHVVETKMKAQLSEQTLQMWRQVVWQFRGVAHSREQTLDYLLRALCLHLADEMGVESQPLSSLDSHMAERMKAYVDARAGDGVNLQDVAAYVGLSVSRSVQIFKLVFGRTIAQYLQEIRLKTACDRIRFSQMTLEEAAVSSGFRSYSYFYRVFRSRYGMSPKQFRANLM